MLLLPRDRFLSVSSACHMQSWDGGIWHGIASALVTPASVLALICFSGCLRSLRAAFGAAGRHISCLVDTIVDSSCMFLRLSPDLLRLSLLLHLLCHCWCGPSAPLLVWPSFSVPCLLHPLNVICSPGCLPVSCVCFSGCLRFCLFVLLNRVSTPGIRSYNPRLVDIQIVLHGSLFHRLSPA
jgi:hypothetical protein